MGKLRTFLHTFVFWGYFIAALPVLFVPALIVYLVALPFDPNGRALHYYTCVWCAHHLWLNPFWRLDIQGKENIRRDQAYVYTANHNSSGDIAVLFSLLLPFKFVSKHQNFRVPILGWNMYMNRYIRLERGNPESVRQMMETCRMWLARGVSIMMFPEGTRSRTGEMLPFKPGAFKLAMDAGVPVVPIVLDGTFEALPPTGILGQDRVLPIRVRICEPIDSRGFTDVTAFSDAVRARMVEEQARLRLLPDAGRVRVSA